MFKSTIAAATAAVAFAPAAALAGPYVNVEINAGWTGDNYTGLLLISTLSTKVPSVSPALLTMSKVAAIVAADGAENSTRFSGKAGVGIPVSDALGVYGGFSFITAEDEFMDDLGVGGKLGLKYNF